jgi:HK97 family phage portal protein
MNYWKNIARTALAPFLAKASAVGPLIARVMLGHAVWPKRDYEKLGREGYQQNAVVHACIELISKAVADIPMIVYKGKGDAKKEIDDHPILDLLADPNPEQDWTAFVRALVSYRSITGNTYIERTDEKKIERMELYALRPDRMQIVPGPTGTPEAFEYKVNGMIRRFDVDSDAGLRPVLHWKTFNPIDDWYGLSPLDACAWDIDMNNGAKAWNKALLDNAAAPSGAFVYSGDEKSGNQLGDEHYERLRNELRGMRSSHRRGEAMVLDGGLTWETFGFNPEQMQQHQALDASARTIAFTLGVPPMLLGIPGDNTYSNYQEARLAFYQETVIPLAQELARIFSRWFRDQLGKGVALEAHIDKIDALQAVRLDHWDRVEKSTVLSLNEKRAELGYDKVDGGDGHYVSAGQIPVATPMVVDAGTGKEEQPPADAKPGDKKPPPKGKGKAEHLSDRIMHFRPD